LIYSNGFLRLVYTVNCGNLRCLGRTGKCRCCGLWWFPQTTVRQTTVPHCFLWCCLI